jgi:hypothetical protein
MRTSLAGLLSVAFGLFAASSLHPALAQQNQPGARTTDEYARYELDAPATATVRVILETSVVLPGATDYRDPVARGTTVTKSAATDPMTGQPLTVTQAPDAVVVKLARAVPKDGQGRLRLDKTVKNAAAYTATADQAVWTTPLVARRGLVVLPAGYQLVGCNLPVQVIAEPDGRVSFDYMAQEPALAFLAASPAASFTQALTVRMRPGAQTGASAAPTPLTNTRSWEPPPAQGPTERARLGERAHQDRDITYFLQEPSTNSFSLFHDYTESRPGIDKYVNVVRTGSKVSNPSAIILDTGEKLKDEILRGQEITKAKIDEAGTVTPETEVVVVHFDPVKAGQSVRLRISETYAAPESYRLEGADLVFDRSLGRPRNSVVLPPGWYLTALSIPGMISETPDHLIRIDFYNGRNDSIDVLIKGRKTVK